MIKKIFFQFIFFNFFLVKEVFGAESEGMPPLSAAKASLKNKKLKNID